MSITNLHLHVSDICNQGLKQVYQKKRSYMDELDQ